MPQEEKDIAAPHAEKGMAEAAPKHCDELFIDIRSDPYNYVMRTVFSRWKPFILHAMEFDEGKSIIPILDKVYEWGWKEMRRRGIPIDSIGEMWHGFRERDKKLMKRPYKARQAEARQVLNRS